MEQYMQNGMHCSAYFEAIFFSTRKNIDVMWCMCSKKYGFPEKVNMVSCKIPYRNKSDMLTQSCCLIGHPHRRNRQSKIYRRHLGIPFQMMLQRRP